MAESTTSWNQLSLPFEKDDLTAMLEVLLLISSEPLTLQRIVDVTGGLHTLGEVKTEIESLAESYNRRNSGLQIIAVAGGYRLCTRPQFDHLVRRFHQERRRVRLSLPALETLAIIAYRQPITTPEIEAIRGVSVSAIVKTLLERHLIMILGRKKAVGKPLIYGTTPQFLEYFGLTDLSALPSMEEFFETIEEKPFQDDAPQT